MKKHWAAQEKTRFLVVGAYNTLFGYLAFAGLYLLLREHLHYLAVMVLSHALGVCNAFITHRTLVFKVSGHLFRDFLRFNLSYVGVLALGLAGMPVLVELFRIPPLVGSALLLALTTLSSFLLHKHLSFRRPSEKEGGGKPRRPLGLP